ncbi:DVU0298 family protein [Desulfocicer niacini]
MMSSETAGETASFGMRELKRRMHELLCMSDETKAMEQILLMDPRRAVNALFTYIQHTTESVKWRAVRAMGRVVAAMATEKPEQARVFMRRLMWSLNDESGGIGWGAPEAMGEIMARNKTLAREYRNILVSYTNPQGNYLEYEPLRQGADWAMDRVRGVYPDFLDPSF